MKTKIIGHILFWTTLVSPSISIYLTSLIGETNIFGMGGLLRYSWVIWLFSPIGMLSILVGIKLKKNHQKYKKNFVIAFIILPLILIFGSYRFLFTGVISYDVYKIIQVGNKIKVDMPPELKVATIKYDEYDFSYAKIINNDSRIRFENNLRNNHYWQKSLTPGIKGLLPVNIQYELKEYDSYIFFNSTTNEFNNSEVQNGNVCIFVAYNKELRKLLVLDNYEVYI